MTLKKARLFPNISTLGYYDPFKFKIHLNIFTEDEFKNIRNASYAKTAILVHELQHWVDHHSTLWGIKYLEKIFNSYHVCIFPHEAVLYNHRQLGLFINRNIFNEYYTEKYNEAVGTFDNRWMFRLTAGFRFDYKGNVDRSKPIPFIRFYDHNDKPIIRLPISVAALLEATAVYSEYRYKLNAISTLGEPHRNNQLARINKDLEMLFHNSALTIYIGIVHMTAKFLDIQNPLEAYHCSAIISKITLNLPQTVMAMISIPKEHELPDNACKQMVSNGELGY